MQDTQKDCFLTDSITLSVFKKGQYCSPQLPSASPKRGLSHDSSPGRKWAWCTEGGSALLYKPRDEIQESLSAHEKKIFTTKVTEHCCIFTSSQSAASCYSGLKTRANPLRPTFPQHSSRNYAVPLPWPLYVSCTYKLLTCGLFQFHLLSRMFLL